MLIDWNSTLARLRDDQANWPLVARETGLTLQQVRRIARGETTRPRIDSVEAIARHYAQRELTAQ